MARHLQASLLVGVHGGLSTEPSKVRVAQMLEASKNWDDHDRLREALTVVVTCL